MKKLISLIPLAILLNGCRYIDTSEKYIDEQPSKPLIIPAGVDKPNSTSTLEIPDVKDKRKVTEASRVAPPDMPFRKKQSDDGKKRIEVKNGLPVLIAQVSKDKMWNAMNSIKLENWEITDSNVDTCEVIIKYTDAEAEERKKANFLKKMFTRDNYYTDYSNSFKLNCQSSGNITEMTFSQKDGHKPKSFLVDTVMENIYKKI